MWIFPLGAAAVSAVFAAQLFRQWAGRRRPNLLSWGLALTMFSLASAAVTVGLIAGWTVASFRAYYLFGAILNVPLLGLGTIYLLAPARVGHVCAAVVAAASLYATALVFTTELRAGPLAVEGIPRASAVVPSDVRELSRYYSYAGFVVVLGGALWSAGRLWRRRTDPLRRLAVANVLIAAGTTVVAAGSAFARYGQGSVFAITLFAGVTLMFVGFLRAKPRRDLAPTFRSEQSSGVSARAGEGAGLGRSSRERG